MSKSVVALYNSRGEASKAVDSLVASGITNNDISVLMSDTTHEKEFGVEVNSKVPEGGLAGSAIGGTIGAIAAGLTSVGAVALTGGAGVLAAGPIVAALAGGGAGAAVGGITGSLIGLGFDENEAKLVDKDLDNGAILVAAEVPDDREDKVEEMFKNSGAKNVTVH